MESIPTELIEINKYFKSVIDLIPASCYFQTNESPETKDKVPKWKNQGGKQELSLRAKQKLVKKRKFDPQHMKTTSERITGENLDEDDIVKKKSKIKSDPAEEISPSFSALQERLREKIAELQLKRNPKNRSEEEAEIIRERRKKERTKLKIKKKMKNQNHLNHPTAELRGLPGQKNAEMYNGGAGKKAENGSIVNSQGKVVFSKFDFGEEPGVTKKGNKRKMGKGEAPSAKNLKILLAKAENKKEELENLKLTDPEEAAKIVKKESWEKALAKAEGTKVRDDPELLKKSLKKEKAIKKQHAKKWKEREENVKEKMQRRQEKRERNIQARKDQNKEKKIQKRSKRFAKSVPGF